MHLRTSARQRKGEAPRSKRFDGNTASGSSDSASHQHAQEQLQGPYKRKANRWNLYQKQQGSNNSRRVAFDYRVEDDAVKADIDRTCRAVDSQPPAKKPRTTSTRFGKKATSKKIANEREGELQSFVQSQCSGNATRTTAYEGGGRLMDVAAQSLANRDNTYLESVMSECKLRLKASRQVQIHAKREQECLLTSWAETEGLNSVQQLGQESMQVRSLLPTLHAEPSSTPRVPCVLKHASHSDATS